MPITEGDTITSDTATSNGNFHNAGIQSIDTTSTFDSDVVHTLPADTTTTLDSDGVHTLPVEKCHLQGSRLFNLQNLHDAIKTISEHSVKCGAVVDLVGEVQRNGLASRLLATCSNCNEEILFSSCNKVVLYNHDGKERPTWAYNAAAVMGQMATGGGHNSLEEMLATLGVPSLAKRMFTEIERCLGTSFEQLLLELMVKTGNEEKQMAKQNNEYHEGIPAITVVVDGGWSKRSHKHSYNANSGVGVIFGAATKKLLYIGVRNKYCAVCSIAQKHSSPPPEHMCFKNWSGSSTAMEADIIAAGFRQSEAMHGLRYIKVIGDGDSSVLHTIHTTVPYGRYVSKLECANHCVKCYRSHLEQMVKDFPHFKGRGNLSKRTIIKIAYGARCAIHKRAQDRDVENLRKDLRAGPRHYLGYHELCDSSWCNDVGTDNNRSIDDLPVNMLFELDRAGDRLINKASQLIDDETTNISECYMSVRSKMDGGKQINRIQSGAFQHRCMAAGLRLTLGPGWITETWKSLFGSCSNVMSTFSNTRKRKHEKDVKRKLTQTYKKARIEAKYHLGAAATTDSSYGPHATQPDTTTDEELQKICNEYLTSIKLTQQQAIALTNVDQDGSLNSTWQQARRCRLTSSSFGRVAKRRSKYEKLVESMLYKPPPSTVKALEWGRSHEDIARSCYVNEKVATHGDSYRVVTTGIHVCMHKPWLAASPDGLVEDPSEPPDRQHGLLEIKCPYSARMYKPETACTELNRFCCNLVNGTPTLKKTHDYYYQIQGALYITGRPWCDLFIWTPIGTFVERLDYDPTFWDKAYVKLHKFYHEYLLPELANPCYPRGQQIHHLHTLTQ